MASFKMNQAQEETTSYAINKSNEVGNKAATKANQLLGDLRNGMGNVAQQMEEKRDEFDRTKANLKARVNETKANAKLTIEQKQADLEEYKARNAAIQAQGQHAYLSHGWSGLKEKVAQAKQKAIEAKNKLKTDKEIFDNAKAAAHAKALAEFNALPDAQAGQNTYGLGQAGTSLSGKSFELGGGRRRRRRRKSRRKKKSKKKKGGRKSRKKKRKRKTRKKKRRRNRKKSRRRRRR